MLLSQYGYGANDNRSLCLEQEGTTAVLPIEAQSTPTASGCGVFYAVYYSSLSVWVSFILINVFLVVLLLENVET